MAFRIHDAFDVGAPMDRGWRYLIDPRQVVECLPGAELTQVQDERTVRPGGVRRRELPERTRGADRVH